ncbi:MAG: 50S ribosomal protein L15 [Gemmatimonadetes bacterium RIFCSPLOWO2_12_FULL_68_9]|nr:MAG: 50S ribosomal protein L15 [Gemmatimonadetes bacterium RIFCSPLOWO2_12_FULL_68_9]
MGLHNLQRPEGSATTPKRKGRGPGSGLGKTAGRGHKGQRARKSGNVRPGFEGGQMPLIRRVPKRGFTNPFRTPAQVVNLRQLVKLSSDEVTPATLVAAGLVSRADDPVKILGVGEVARAYVVKGCAASAGARKKIEQAGGRFEG